MKKTICLFLVIVLCFSIMPTCYASAENASFSDDPKAIQVASNSVIMLSCYDKNGELYATGSAFAAFEEGVFITNCHVIKDEVYSIKAQMETGLEFKISSVVAYDDERDLAILRTEAKTGLEPLPLGSVAALERAGKVIAIGSPLGLINTISIGLYSGTIKNENQQTFLQFSAPISHGSSGGALFNDKGEVVGITSASYTEGQNLNLAIPIEDAVDLWEKRESSAELSIPDFYDLWDHIQTYSVSYILSHKSEFSNGMIINVYGYVFYNPANHDPSSQTKRNYSLVETLENLYALRDACEELEYVGGALSGSEEISYHYHSTNGDLDPNLAKRYELQNKYYTLSEKVAFGVSGYKQNGTVAFGEYVLVQGQLDCSNDGIRLKKVTVVDKSGN